MASSDRFIVGPDGVPYGPFDVADVPCRKSIPLPRVREIGPAHWQAAVLMNGQWHDAYGDSKLTALMSLAMDLAERLEVASNGR